MLGKGEGLSESEAAQMIVDDARQYLQVRQKARANEASKLLPSNQNMPIPMEYNVSVSEKKVFKKRLR
jgi:hypothetical protein